MTCADKLWAIAHMVNNKENVDYSLNAGANGLEMDLTFDDSGNPAYFYHDWFCDCKCSNPEVCRFNVCENAQAAGEVLGHFMSHKKMGQVAMLYIDSKLDAVPNNLLEQAAANMIKLLEDRVFSKGYKGIVFIGAASAVYLTSLASTASQSSHKDHLFIGYDWYTGFKDGLELLADLKYPNKIASTGMFRCLKWAMGYEDEAIMGRVNKARGVISDMIIWTLDTTEEYDRYYDYGARGIISNNPTRLVNWAASRGYQLYTTEDMVCGATAGKENLVTDVGDCGCEKNDDGCKIDDEVTSVEGTACTCEKQYFLWIWFTGCIGDVVGCLDVTSEDCLNPDGSRMSCMQGGGDCGGY